MPTEKEKKVPRYSNTMLYRWGEGKMIKPLWECNPLDPQILALETTLDPQDKMASVHAFYRKYRVRENGDGLAAPRSTLPHRSCASPTTALLCFSVLCKEKISQKMSSN